MDDLFEDYLKLFGGFGKSLKDFANELEIVAILSAYGLPPLNYN